MSDQRGPPNDGKPLPTDAHVSPFAPPEVACAFHPGAVIKARYVLERLLGHGAMGEVYFGCDNSLGRPVAVKVIRPRDPQPQNRTVTEAHLQEAFLEEARIGAGLTHPAIATVYDFGFHGEEPFIVFEYIAGETLREVIRRRGRLPLEEVRLIVAPLAQALDFAHSRHVVHCDLKPENIRATAEGQFKILDLGLARQFRRALDWSFAGTPAYTSPEQAGGLPCDGRTDQYALALIAHELLTGHRLFEHTDWQELLRMHREDEPPSPRRCLPDLPESVCAALGRGFAKDPNQRFGSCAAFAAALGCPLLSAPVAQAEIHRLTTVSRMRGQWNSPRFALTRKGTAVCLALSSDALWVVYQGDLRRLPLQAVTEVSRGSWGKEMRLRFQRSGQTVFQAFHFSSRAECQQWCQDLQEAKGRLPPGAEAPTDWTDPGPVLLVFHPPAMRYQALGRVDYQDGNVGRAVAGLQIRAAMLGAEAVVDVHEEWLPRLGQTVNRLSGTAIRAVDTPGRVALRSRWFAAQVSQLCFWMVLLIGVNFANCLVQSMAFNLGIAGLPLAPGETVWRRLAVVFQFFVALHAWPLSLAVLTRWRRWPPLLRPAALTTLLLPAIVFAATPLGRLAAGVVSGHWAGSTLFLLTFVDPITLVTLLFAGFLCRRAWRAYRHYRDLLPDAGRPIPLSRRWVKPGVVAVVVLFSLLWGGYMGGYMTWAHYQQAHLFAAADQKGRDADARFLEGVARLNEDPRGAEQAFRQALALYEKGIASPPSRPEHLCSLGVTWYNLGVALSRQGEWAEADKAFRQALAHCDRIEANFPRFKGHQGVRELARQALAQQAEKSSLFVGVREDLKEVSEGERLDAAGQHRAAAEHYRKALARHEQRKKEIASENIYRHLLAVKQNRLAWFLVVCPEPGLRDPKQAVDLARQAVEAFPLYADYRGAPNFQN